MPDTAAKAHGWAGLLIVREDGRFLLALRAPWLPDPLLWSVPGGKIESGEEPLEAALREAEEELGELLQVRILDSYVDQKARFTTFLALMSERTARRWSPVLNPENVDWGWYHLEDLPQPLHPGVMRAFQFFLE